MRLSGNLHRGQPNASSRVVAFVATTVKPMPPLGHTNAPPSHPVRHSGRCGTNASSARACVQGSWSSGWECKRVDAFAFGGCLILCGVKRRLQHQPAVRDRASLVRFMMAGPLSGRRYSASSVRPNPHIPADRINQGSKELHQTVMHLGTLRHILIALHQMPASSSMSRTAFAQIAVIVDNVDDGFCCWRAR